MGNEKLVNQLIAHHSVIFKPSELKMWISTSPYQLGAYLCYDLNQVFADSTEVSDQIWLKEETIASDTFLTSDQFVAYREFTKKTSWLKAQIDLGEVNSISDDETDNYIRLNPDFYYSWFIAGEIYRLKGNVERASEYYDQALLREIPREVDRVQVEEAKQSLY